MILETEMPKDGETYYWVSTNTGEICKSIWKSRNQFCIFRWSVGLVFRTWDSAHFALSDIQHDVENKRRALK